MFVENRKIGLD